MSSSCWILDIATETRVFLWRSSGETRKIWWPRWFPWWEPHRLSPLSPPGDPTMGPCVRAPAISVPHGCKRTFGPLMAHRAVNPRKGIRVLARCLPYPECERLPFAPERVEASPPWSCNKLPGPSSRMETDDRRVW